MKDNNVPNKEEKENVFGNMLLEPEHNSFSEVININQENIPNIKHQLLEKEEEKKTNFISFKTKKYKNHYKKKGEGSNTMNAKSKNNLNTKNNIKGMKKKGSKEIDKNIILSINNKIGQSNSSVNNHEIEDNCINNKNLNLNEIQKINEEEEKNDMNIENQENNGNIINNNISTNTLNLENINTEKNPQSIQILSFSLTYNDITITDSNSAFIPIEYVNEIWDSFLEKEKYKHLRQWIVITI